MAERSEHITKFLPLPGEVNLPIETTLDPEQLAAQSSLHLRTLLWAGQLVATEDLSTLDEQVINTAISLLSTEEKSRETYKDTNFVKNRVQRIRSSLSRLGREFREDDHFQLGMPKTTERLKLEVKADILHNILDIGNTRGILEAEMDYRNSEGFFQEPATTGEVMGITENSQTQSEDEETNFDTEYWSQLNVSSDDNPTQS